MEKIVLNLVELDNTYSTISASATRVSSFQMTSSSASAPMKANSLRKMFVLMHVEVDSSSRTPQMIRKYVYWISAIISILAQTSINAWRNVILVNTLMKIKDAKEFVF